MPSQSQPSRHRPQTASSSSSPVPPARDPEYIAIVLAATQGRRLFPLTSEYPDGVPKHLLPVSPLNGCDAGRGGAGGGGGGGGATLLRRLLTRTHESGFEMMVVAIHAEDRATIPSLLGTDRTTGPCRPLGGENASLLATVMLGGDDDDIVTDLEFHGDVVVRSPPTSSNPSKKQQQQQQPSSSSSANDERTRRCMHVRVVRLPEGCDGSADALRFLSSRGSIDDDEGNGGGGGGESSSSPATSESRDERNDGTNDSDDRRRRSIIPRTSHAVIMPGDLIAEAALLSSSSSSTTDTDVLSLLVQAHRRWNAGPPGSAGAACTMLLADAGAEDKEGVPLKESSKAKMGLFSREEEDMEYVGLSSEVPPPPSASLASLSHSSKHSEAHATPSRRVVLKRSKLEVEEDEGTGSTPKLVVPKRRLHSAGRDRRRGGKGRGAMSSTATVDRSPAISLRTDLHDVHLYAISNWVFELIHARPNMQSFQGEVLPLLISRQYRGVEAAFGPTAWKEERNRERLRKVLKDLDGTAEENGRVSCDKVAALLGMYASGKMSGGLGGFLPADDDDHDDDHGAPNPADELGGSTPKAVDDPAASAAGSSLLSPPFPSTRRAYAVSAQVLSREASSLTLRASTLPSLLYGCGAVTRRTLGLDPSASSSLVAEGTTLSAKFDSVLAPSCAVGEKVQTKGCTVVGDGVSLGDRARLNNVVVMDGVAVGNNTVLQNSLVGANARIGDNCNLRDCQVGPGAVVPSGTKTTEKGEAFHV